MVSRNNASSSAISTLAGSLISSSPKCQYPWNHQAEYAALPGGRIAHSRRPPNDWASYFEIESPKPSPAAEPASAFVVKNGSKMLARTSSLMPTP